MRTCPASDCRVRTYRNTRDVVIQVESNSGCEIEAKGTAETALPEPAGAARETNENFLGASWLTHGSTKR